MQRLAAPRAGKDRGDIADEGHRAACQHLLRGAALDRICQQFGKGDAGIDGFLCTVRRPALPGCDIAQLWPVLPVPDGDRGKPHQAAVAGGMGIGGPGNRITAALVALKC